MKRFLDERQKMNRKKVNALPARRVRKPFVKPDFETDETVIDVAICTAENDSWKQFLLSDDFIQVEQQRSIRLVDPVEQQPDSNDTREEQPMDAHGSTLETDTVDDFHIVTYADSRLESLAKMAMATMKKTEEFVTSCRDTHGLLWKSATTSSVLLVASAPYWSKGGGEQSPHYYLKKATVNSSGSNSQHLTLVPRLEPCTSISVKLQGSFDMSIHRGVRDGRPCNMQRPASTFSLVCDAEGVVSVGSQDNFESQPEVWQYCRVDKDDVSFSFVKNLYAGRHASNECVLTVSDGKTSTVTFPFVVSTGRPPEREPVGVRFLKADLRF
eukprot:TRINITY_DN2158_c0_g1_i2.p1 TRINITY_DN2158_c0_g1~~TRINITY_DN2158_c0_g1_i2.p1  ORF type:complete len:327 (+),score=8.47 TRINITY_DN2158_c0_g1_i2:742-1722(+)